MILKEVSLFNFKNYEQAKVSFGPGFNGIYGENGEGKTNLLDAIYFLCFTKSAFQSNDSYLIRHGESFCLVKGKFEFEDKVKEVSGGIEKGPKKTFSENTAKYDKLSDHIGEYPAVMVSPYDMTLIREGSEERRKFLDGLLSQINRPYLLNILKYKKILKQRNAILKQFDESGFSDPHLIEPYTVELIKTGKEIYTEREKLTKQIGPIIEEQYSLLTNNKEKISIRYRSDYQKEDFEDLFYKQFDKELILGRTTMGTHKDELIFNMNDRPLKKLGSQGQQKSFLIALKLAQYKILKESKGFTPILLLDDIYDKLDDNRIKGLIQLLAGKEYGQVFISDARPERSAKLMETIGETSRLYVINSGEIDEMTD
ncbi:DNA replication and repair protein RecF [Mangrovivirga sp. M17]|uniref:DNA replication and repair protein RecF n=1 Tax=Mangrovivirga halotolerans TaxID=2993936 RepID=A0ABT3RTK5_9BACT|nr:DNA replication and repair protein RecF [Mangrovivirga halotolerans]MCX2744688.1 DNA replication and repair protein RecF [Mangrovivirga halotolerans]